jgi:membrane protease subunit HflC
MSNKSLTALIVGVVAAIVLWNSFYIVSQTERAVLLRFGRIVEPDVKPGLHMKIPYVNSVRKFDARLLTLDTTTSRFLTLEKKALMVDSYAKWRVDDAERFYTATSGVKQIADERLARRLEAALRDQFGKRTLHESVSGQRDELMAQVTTSLNRAAQQELGIEVVDVRVKGIDLPREVNRSVFERMSSEREREAREHRAKGKELAEGIRADADRQRRVLLAEAFREAEELRGDGDAKAAAIYASAYGQDQEFYAFHRSLQAYRESFSSKEDVLVLDPKSDFFRYLQSSMSRFMPT